MPGALTIKLIEANITHETFQSTRCPYCILKVGDQKVTSEVSVTGGNHPHWDDNLTVQTRGEDKCELELKDKHFFLPDFSIGSVEIDLKELEQTKNQTKWLKIKHKDNEAGEILIETTFIPGSFDIDEPMHSTVKSVIENEKLYDRPEKKDYHDIISDEQDKGPLKDEGEVHRPDYSGQGGFIHSGHSGLDKTTSKEIASMMQEGKLGEGGFDYHGQGGSVSKGISGLIDEGNKGNMMFSGKEGESSEGEFGGDTKTNAGKE